MYTTYLDITEMLKGIYINDDAVNDHPTAVISKSQLLKYMTAAEALVTGQLYLKYTLPIDSTTSPNSFALVRDIIAGFVAAKVYNILKLSGVLPVESDEMKKMISLYGQAKSQLTQIMNNELVLVDAVRLESIEDNVYDAGSLTEQNFLDIDPANKPY